MDPTCTAAQRGDEGTYILVNLKGRVPLRRPSSRLVYNIKRDLRGKKNVSVWIHPLHHTKKKKGKRSFGHGDESSHFIEGGEMLLSWKTRPVTFPTGTPLLVGNMSLTSYFRSVTVRGLWLRDNLYTVLSIFMPVYLHVRGSVRQ